MKERLKRLKSLVSDSETEKPSMVTKDTLYSFYMRILDTLPGDPKRIRKIFMWLVTAHTPMTLAELRVVSAFDPDLHTSRASMKDDLALGDFGAYLKANCGALVKIVEASQTVHLVHQSVREFFLDANHPFGFNQVDEEAYISEACLTFLSFKDLANSPAGTNPSNEYEYDFRLQNECPFLRYAALYWPHHAETVLDSSDALWNQFVSWANSDNLNLCFRIFWHHKGTGEFPRNATPMHIICYQGSEWLLARAFAAQKSLKWVVVDAQDSLGRTPLHWAAITGHEKVVKLLLKNGANQFAKDRSDSTPIELAIYFGNLQAVQALAHMDVGGYGDQSSQWMEMAVIGGHTAVVEFLLNNGANPNVPSPTSENGSPLHSAASEGHTDIVELLVSRGADLHYNCPKDGYPLQTAAFRWSLGPVKMMIAKGADPSVGPGIRGTPLQIAAFRGSEDIVVELIERGANVNAGGGPFGSALEAAEYAGHTIIQTLLKKAGAVSTRPCIKRRESRLKDFLDCTKLLAADLKKGRQSNVEKKANFFKTEIISAIRSRNRKSIALFIGTCDKVFKIVLKLRRRDLIELLLNMAMTILGETLKVGWEEGFDMLLTGWVKTLPSLAKESRWLPILESVVSSCIRDIELLVAQEEYEEARNQIIVTFSVYVMLCETENAGMIELLTRVVIEVYKDLMTGVFARHMDKIIEEFIGKWAEAVKTRDELVSKRIGRAGAELLLLGVERQVLETVTLVSLIIIYVQKVLDSGQPDTVKSMLHNGCPGHPAIFQEQDLQIGKNMVMLAAEMLISITQLQQNPGNSYREAQILFSDLFAAGVKNIDSLGLLGMMEETIEELALHKFKRSRDESHLNEQEGQFLKIAEAMPAAENIRISTAMENVKKGIRKSAESVRKSESIL